MKRTILFAVLLCFLVVEGNELLIKRLLAYKNLHQELKAGKSSAVGSADRNSRAKRSLFKKTVQSLDSFEELQKVKKDINPRSNIVQPSQPEKKRETYDVSVSGGNKDPEPGKKRDVYDVSVSGANETPKPENKRDVYDVSVSGANEDPKPQNNPSIIKRAEESKKDSDLIIKYKTSPEKNQHIDASNNNLSNNKQARSLNAEPDKIDSLQSDQTTTVLSRMNDYLTNVPDNKKNPDESPSNTNKIRVIDFDDTKNYKHFEDSYKYKYKDSQNSMSGGTIALLVLLFIVVTVGGFFLLLKVFPIKKIKNNDDLNSSRTLLTPSQRSSERNMQNSSSKKQSRTRNNMNYSSLTMDSPPTRSSNHHHSQSPHTRTKANPTKKSTTLLSKYTPSLKPPSFLFPTDTSLSNYSPSQFSPSNYTHTDPTPPLLCPTLTSLNYRSPSNSSLNYKQPPSSVFPSYQTADDITLLSPLSGTHSYVSEVENILREGKKMVKKSGREESYDERKENEKTMKNEKKRNVKRSMNEVKGKNDNNGDFVESEKRSERMQKKVKKMEIEGEGRRDEEKKISKENQCVNGSRDNMKGEGERIKSGHIDKIELDEERRIPHSDKNKSKSKDNSKVEKESKDDRKDRRHKQDVRKSFDDAKESRQGNENGNNGGQIDNKIEGSESSNNQKQQSEDAWSSDKKGIEKIYAQKCLRYENNSPVDKLNIKSYQLVKQREEQNENKERMN